MELDVNTDADREDELDSDLAAQLLREAIGLADEIADQGDIK